MSYTKIENFLYEIEHYLMEKYGCDAAYRELSPLKWYITTGRASAPFLHSLLESKPFVIARLLHKGGSDDEVISRLKAKLNIESY